MCTSRRYCQRGVTLIELIVFIIVVSVGLAGVLTVFNVVGRSSGDPLVVKQAHALADALLEEILLKDFCDPTRALDLEATTTSGSASVTAISPALDHPATAYAGWRIVGNGIPAGTTISAVASATALTLTTNANASAVGAALRILPCVDESATETRSTFDNVRDYHADTVWQDAVDVSGDAIFTPPSLYQTQVGVQAVDPTTIGTAGANVANGDIFRVTVRVRAPDGQVYSATGYRYFHD